MEAWPGSSSRWFGHRETMEKRPESGEPDPVNGPVHMMIRFAGSNAFTLAGTSSHSTL
jgi:hypothetical protein